MTDFTQERHFTGIGIATGGGIGPAVIANLALPVPVEERHLAPGEVPNELIRLHQAIAAARRELDSLAKKVSVEVGPQESEIFVAQSLMLADPTIAEQSETIIRQHLLSAASAIQQVGESEAAAIAEIDDPTLRARAADVRDVVSRVIGLLQGGQGRQTLNQMIAALDTSPVLVARDLGPSEMTHIQADRLVGIVLSQGGPTSHTAILARALGIPTVVGLGDAFLDAVGKDTLIGLDAERGEVVVAPTEETQARFTRLAALATQRKHEAQQLAQRWRNQLSQTADGWRVIVAANVGSAQEALIAGREAGAEGIGLLRTEFLFSDRQALPDEDEQTEIYAQIFAAFTESEHSAMPIVARTLDAGSDKPVPALKAYMPEEENPALGYRGIRLQLDHPEVLLTQVRALLRAAGATHVAVQIMFPMIATLGELRKAEGIFQQAYQQLHQERVPVPADVPLGIMIETPAAIFTADALVRECQFLSIGSNDLTQYIMACDRLNPQVASLYNALQPAVLRAIAQAIRAAKGARRPIAVCGEMAGDPLLARLLVGMGIDELSLTPTRIPLVKEALAQTTYPKLRQWADRLLAATTLEESQDLLAQGGL